MTTQQKRTYAILLVVNSVVSFALYRAMLFLAAMTDNALPSFVVMLVYSLVLLGFGLAYLIYNRFFYKKGITKDQLPDSMTPEQKDAFIKDGELRLERSRWMLLIILPLLITFLIDALDLFVLELFR